MPSLHPAAGATPSPNQNHLIAALPAAEFDALCSALEPVPLLLGQMLYEPGVPLRHVVFPTTAVVSLHHVMASGASAETCSVGCEGMVGVALLMGGDTTPSSAVVQTAVCYRHHSIEQQLSRWLLCAVDRAPPGEMVMTQELVASMLGVRRESITLAAGHFQEAGYIRYRRGHITVLDAAGLASCACECYGVVKAEMDRLLTETRLRQGQGQAAASA